MDLNVLFKEGVTHEAIANKANLFSEDVVRHVHVEYAVERASYCVM